MDNAAGTLPMKKIGSGIEHVELADAHPHRVGIAVDVTVLRGAVEAVPETAIVTHIWGSKSDSPTSHKAKHDAGGEFLHFAMILPILGNSFSKVTYLSQNRYIQDWV